MIDGPEKGKEINMSIWNDISVSIKDCSDRQEALEKSGLNWTVAKRPFLVDDIEATNYRAITRSDNGHTLGIVSPAYEPCQNSEVFELMYGLVSEGLCKWNRAGQLGNGQRIWVSGLIGEYNVGACDVGDIVRTSLFLSTSHDGSKAFRMSAYAERLICENGMVSKHGFSEFSIRHTKSFRGRLLDAVMKFDRIVEQLDSMREETIKLVATKIDTDRAMGYFRSLFPLNEKSRNETILASVTANYFNPNNNLRGMESTLWSAYNAVSEYTDHQATFRGKDSTKRAENRFISVTQGKSAEKKKEAWNLALQLAN